MIVLSDIHANLPALEAVLEDAGEDTVLFCGDLVGYGASPRKVIEHARDHDFIAVRGNHDEAVVTGSTFGFRGAAAEAARWTRDQLSDDDLSYLRDLPYTRRETYGSRDILMAHGSPDRPLEQYVRETMVDAAFLDRQGVDTDVLLLGHTHVPFARKAGDTLVVNPGSVGQPRDGDPRASYVTLDPETRDATVHRVDYDIDRAAAGIQEAGLPATLAARLSQGR